MPRRCGRGYWYPVDGGDTPAAAADIILLEKSPMVLEERRH